METSKTNFVEQYKPGAQARVELVNGRILDVVNGRYCDEGTSVILQDGGIVSMPGLAGEPCVPVDYRIDLKGKTVLPSLFSTPRSLVDGWSYYDGLWSVRHAAIKEIRGAAESEAYGRMPCSRHHPRQGRVAARPA